MGKGAAATVPCEQSVPSPKARPAPLVHRTAAPGVDGAATATREPSA